MKKSLVPILAISIGLLAQGCVTSNGAAVAPFGSDFLNLALVPFVAFDKPGPFGNWWRKEPLDDEKTVFNHALKGPLSPKDKVKNGDFVGWFGVLVGCSSVSKEKSRLTLDHRFASDLNLQFGPRDSQSIHTISLFGDGIFYADINKPCNPTALDGDLLRVYGIVSEQHGNIFVSVEKTRYWPRSTYELTPRRVQRDEFGAVKRLNNGWPDLSFDQSVTNRETAVDEMILASLVAHVSEAKPDIRARAIYSIGELGQRGVKNLMAAQSNEADAGVEKTIDFALKRAKGAIGPFWKTSATEPYWKDQKLDGTRSP